jgi:hypothetical protein
VSNHGLVVPVDGRRMISTGVGITLVVAGAIVRFAVPATFTYGLNAHVVSVIVMLAGVFGCGVPLQGNGMPARTSRQRDVRRSRDRESALRESSSGRRTVSYDGTWPLGSDQSRPVFHPAGC